MQDKLTRPLKCRGVEWICTWEQHVRCDHRATRRLARPKVLNAAREALPGVNLRPALCDRHVDRVRQLVA